MTEYDIELGTAAHGVMQQIVEYKNGPGNGNIWLRLLSITLRSVDAPLVNPRQKGRFA